MQKATIKSSRKWETVSIDKFRKGREKREPLWSEKTAEEMKLELDVGGFRLDWRERHGTSGQYRLICKKTETSGRIKTSALHKHVYLLFDRDANKCPNSENPPVHSFVHPPTF